MNTIEEYAPVFLSLSTYEARRDLAIAELRLKEAQAATELARLGLPPVASDQDA